MLELEQAKKLVSEQLDVRSEAKGIPLRIVEESIETHDWGWVIYWEPVHSNEQVFTNPTIGMPYLVDKISGHVRSAGTYGLKISISKLLRLRGG